MNYRKLGKTGWSVSEISLGTWQVGGGWGKPFDDKLANRIIHAAIDRGINFIDTADVYDGGLSEAAVGKALRESTERIYIATKCGRQIQPHVNEGYTPEKLRAFVEASLRNTGLETIDLIQLHCPPTPVYRRDEIFGLFEKLKEEGKIHAMGVSLETVDEALAAMKYEIVSSIQVIFNMFRLKPSETLFSHPDIDKFGIIARVPLASGLLTGKLTADTIFSKEDHRLFNRQGEAFDKGETFSGVDYEKGLIAVQKLKEIFHGKESLAAWAIRWVLMFPEVSTVIPGASKIDQVISNVNASGLPEISSKDMDAVRKIYDKYFKADIHQLW
ncbi:aldo/keto reductase [Cognataquiflexum rubidum]|uniref:aldo/keto reductase n=1 Tax=Cognataquiflexum rubidum TaxID=2922273 RepID=UPI001F1446F9|nr:aldo/keto reductase [Cognataquiflexum rubidum]MCH6234346.1 aldo/keto reductase [Cognataquiflexum rubidum]